MKLSFHATVPRATATVLAAAAALSFAQAATAAVKPGDTFSFGIAGFNSSTGAGYLLGDDEVATFGKTTTFTGAGINGQDYTVSSSEVVGAKTTTDYFTFSTPTSFLTTTTVDGTKITTLQLDVGDANSGLTLASGANPVTFSQAIASDTAAGHMIYDSNTSFTLTPQVSLTNRGLDFTAAEGVNAGSSAISGFNVHEFDFSITYANPVSAVPEADSSAMLIAGLGLAGVALRRSRKAKIVNG